MDYFAQQLINGVVMGMQYALFAVGLVLIFGILRLINFAHGAIFCWGGIASVLAVKLVGFNTVVISVIAGLIGGGVLGLIVQYGIMNFLARKRVTDHIPQAVATIGISQVFVGLGSAVVGSNPRSFPSGSISFRVYEILGIEIPRMHLVSVILAFASLVVLDVVIFRTKTGRQIRAVAFDPEISELLGINIERIRVWALVISTSLAGLAGSLTALTLDLSSPYLSEGMLVKGFAIIVIGGMGSVRGAMIAGVLLGVVEALASSYGLGAWREAFGTGLLFAVLMLRPQGLLGKNEVERA